MIRSDIESVDLFTNFICIMTLMKNNIEKEIFKKLNYGQNFILETTRETHKLKEKQLKCDPYSGVILSSIGRY